MFLREVLQSVGNFRKKLDVVILDDPRKAEHLLVQFGRYGKRAQPLKGVDQGVGEAVQAVAVLDDAFTLDVVEDFAHLLGSEFVMIQERDEPGDGALEVDVVFPEGVVGVDEESLGGHGWGVWLLAIGYWLLPISLIRTG